VRTALNSFSQIANHYPARCRAAHAEEEDEGPVEILIVAEHPATACFTLAAAAPASLAHSPCRRAAGEVLAAAFCNRAGPAANQPPHTSCALWARLDCSV